MKKAFVLVIFVLVASRDNAQSANSKVIKYGTSSGRIPFVLSLNQICFPVSINGRPANARLFNAVPSAIDRDLAMAIGLDPIAKNAGQPPQVAVTIQVGALRLQDMAISSLVPHTVVTPANDIRLGDEVFQQFIVDINFPSHTIGFYSPDSFTPPAGAVALPFTFKGNDRAVAMKVEDGPEMYYAVYLGDPAPLSVYANFFQPQGMLNNRVTSVRQGGGARTPPEAVVTARNLQLAGVKLRHVPAVLPDDSVSGPHPADVGGHIGLGTLSRFRVIFDYSHEQLYLIPGAPAVVKAPFVKDRSGLVLKKIQEDYVVTFVCPGSPAQSAGFQPGDTVARVNNQPVPALQGVAWQLAAWKSVLPTAPGKTYAFTLKNGTVRSLTTADFF